LILTDDALLNLSSRTSEQAIAEMAARVPADRLPMNADVAELAIARERELPTNIGVGVAIPHARCPQLVEPLVVVGRSPGGVIVDGDPSERVDLLFLLITPAERPDIQVHLLSRIAAVAGDPACLRRLRSANDANDVAEILAAADAEGNRGC
jgi:mannitol/fructose-specific phosphotransferase system IIA component (Ntr-type)